MCSCQRPSDAVFKTVILHRDNVYDVVVLDYQDVRFVKYVNAMCGNKNRSNNDCCCFHFAMSISVIRSRHAVALETTNMPLALVLVIEA